MDERNTLEIEAQEPTLSEEIMEVNQDSGDGDIDSFKVAALPSQIPEPPKMTEIPLSVLHSSTVDSLISYSDDLVARLKVQIRRNSVLERKSLEDNSQSEKLARELETLQRQHEHFNEKERQQGQKTHELQSQLETTEKDLELLETQFADLKTLKDQQESDHKTQLEDMKSQVEELNELLPLKQDNIALKEDVEQFKKRITELTNHIQSKEDDEKSLRSELTVKQEKLAHAEGQMVQLQNQVDQGLNLREEKAELENLIILKEREISQSSDELQSLQNTYKQETQNLRVLAKNLQNEKAQLEAQLSSAERTLHQYNKDNEDLEKQLDNMQNLWYKLQAELEKEKTKNAALHNLNKELTTQVRSQHQSASDQQEAYYKQYLMQNKDVRDC